VGRVSFIKKATANGTQQCHFWPTGLMFGITGDVRWTRFIGT
jgi:hypothetical protein